MGGFRHPHSRVAPGSPMWRRRGCCLGPAEGPLGVLFRGFLWRVESGREGWSRRADWGCRLLCPSPQREGSRSPRSPQASASLAMNLEPPKAEIRSATRVTGGPVTPRKGPPKFKQRQTRQFKSKPPKKGVQG